MKVSACIIAKNEEENLPRLLESIKDKFDEIILVDTGSTDKTIEIAKNYGCKIYEKEWTGFSDARNYAVSKASGDWIWHFDADFELEDKEFERFKNILNLIKGDDTFDGINVTYRNLNESGEIKSISSTVHIHKKDKDIIWVGKVHERIHNKKKNQVVTPPYTIYVNHYGYAVASLQKEKAKRNLDLLFQEINELEKDSVEYIIKLFYVIQSYVALSSFDKGYFKEVIKYSDDIFKKFKEINEKDSFFSSVFYKHSFVYTVYTYTMLGEYEKAKSLLERGLSEFGDYPDLVYLKAFLYEKEGKTEKAVEQYLNFVYLTDEISESPVKMSAIVSDYVSRVDSLIIDKLSKLEETKKFLEEIEKKWKKIKGEKTALIYYLVLKDENPKKANSLLKKFVRLYKKDLFFIDYISLINEESEKIRLLKQGLEKNPLSAALNLALGNIFYKQKNYKFAFKHFYNYLKVSRDSSIIPLILDSIQGLGYNNEANTLVEKLKQISKTAKKIENTSDNKTQLKKLEVISHGTKN